MSVTGGRITSTMNFTTMRESRNSRRSETFQEKCKRDRMAHHRRLVRNAKSVLDLKPAKLLITTFLRVNKLKDDFQAKKRILQQNINLLERINKIQRITGLTNTFNRYDFPRTTGQNALRRRMEVIRKDNYDLGCRILRAKSSVDTRSSMYIAKRSTTHDVPRATLLEFSEFLPTQNHALVQKLLRPKVFFDLSLQRSRPLGRLAMQLYTETAPEVVLEFVRMCTFNSKNLCKFIRIFPGLWVEGEIKLDEGHLLQNRHECYNMDLINHGAGPGILSFSTDYLNGFPPGLINYTISFKPLPTLRNTRVPFGMVTSGFRMLDCIVDYGTKNGKPKKEIIISKCGILH